MLQFGDHTETVLKEKLRRGQDLAGTLWTCVRAHMGSGSANKETKVIVSH